MKSFVLKSILKLSKSPSKIYSAITDLAPIVFKSVLSHPTPLDYDEIEKKILLSAFVLNFSTQKDVRCDFIAEYVSIFVKDTFKTHDPEEIIYLFENSASGFGFGMSGSPSERRKDAEEALQDYLFNRIISYRFFIEEYLKNNLQNLRRFYFLISEMPFHPGVYHLNPFLGYIDIDIDIKGINENNFNTFQSLLKSLSDNYLNIVDIPKKTRMSEHPESPRFHTEGLLATLHIPIGTQYLSFQSIGGAGIINCKHCHHSQEIISFVHGPMSATIGRQCPQCGEFCAESNESNEYHQFGPSTEDFVCPKCNYTIRRKEESIFKGNENPLFCPKCKSLELEYTSSFLT